jgi:hypothetical protein
MMVNQVDNKLQYHTERLARNPDDLDSLLYVGDSFLLQGKMDEALALYQRALKQKPLRKDIERRVNMARRPVSSPGGGDQAQKTEEEDIKTVLQRLSARPMAVTDLEAAQVRKALDEILTSPSPTQAVAEQLDKVESLLPAQIELDIRQARREGKAEQVETLYRLLELVTAEIETRKSRVTADVDKTRGHRSPLQPVSVVVTGIDSLESPFRQHLLSGALSGWGFDVVMKSWTDVDWKSFDVLIAHNPHADQDLMNGLAMRASLRLPTVVDMVLDFRKLPPEHPEYQSLGGGNPDNMRSFAAALQMANRITVASAAAASGLREGGYKLQWIPEGWSLQNALWQKALPERAFLNLGLFIVPGQQEDVNKIRRAVVRVMREFPNTRLAIFGDPMVYQMFEGISDVRRQFLPPVDPEDYPFLLAQVDILMVPLNETPYNQQKTDRSLLEAGVKRIPWVASPSWAAVEWAEGGLLAYSIDEWYSHLRSLILDAKFRQILGQAGHQKAQQREMKVLGNMWSTVIQQALAARVIP